jgi:spermidine synthase
MLIDQFPGRVVESLTSPYQRIVLVEKDGDVRIYLDGDLQFSTLDEYRYHETLVHPAMAAAKNHQRVLLLGAGDGFAAREVLRWPGVEEVRVVDLDRDMVDLCKNHPLVKRAHGGALDDPRVNLVFADAFDLVNGDGTQWDVIIADLPDAHLDVLAKLYSVEFYQQLRRILLPKGAVNVQSSSPFFAPRYFSTVHQTLAQVFKGVIPLCVDVPSFGTWGFNLAVPSADKVARHPLPEGLRFLTAEYLDALMVMPGDVKLEVGTINTEANGAIVPLWHDPKWKLYLRE